MNFIVRPYLQKQKGEKRREEEKKSTGCIGTGL
jgi:hypothetical protein